MVIVLIRRYTPIKRKPPKRLAGYDNPAYRNWLGSWPCWICFIRYCKENGYDPVESRRRPEVRFLFTALQCFSCGPTEIAHVGLRGLKQRCADREAMPLGRKHHQHMTAGGGPESHHTLGRNFWSFHDLCRVDIFSELYELYSLETGMKA
jgi:hypothetical protein